MRVALIAATVGCTVMAAFATDSGVTVVARPGGGPNAHYVSNRAPLLENSLIQLPVGAIEPRGWVRGQLERERDGMTGHLTEISPWCDKTSNAWLDPMGGGQRGWEELPYWLKGFGDLGYVLRDRGIIDEARVWIEGALASRRPDGWFGPEANRTALDGKPDCWPNMVMLNCLQSYYEFTGDERVIELMQAYFRWQLSVPDSDFLVPFWQAIRAGDNLETVYWLYNRTGEAWLLDLAHKIHRCMADWTGGFPTWHGVNITQGFREPAEYYILSKDPKHLAATQDRYATVMQLYGQVPGGMFGADENARTGCHDPRQAAETCSIVEYMHSFEMLLAMLGDPIWADRCEEVAFNSLPASQPPDLRGLHYLTAPNMVQLDQTNKSPAVQNGGTMLSYDPHSYRCCQHNVSHGWPYFAENLVMATPDNGLAAVLYAACVTTAKVGDGATVRLHERTDYPFSDQIRFEIETAAEVSFPLYLRIPGWCDAPELRVGGRRVPLRVASGGFIRIERAWHDDDSVTLRLPMELRLRTYEANHGSVAVNRGPLTYSLEIGERWVPYGGDQRWPAYEVFPTSPWNYGLVLDGRPLDRQLKVVESDEPVADQPWTLEAAPVRITAAGRRIPEWRFEPTLDIVSELQDSPVVSDGPVEAITLVPMGCARLRISAFPVMGRGPGAHRWRAPAPPPHEASFVHDSLPAISDGILPQRSSDQSIPRFTWWDHRGTREWVTYRFEAPRQVSLVEVYWFDDTGVGSCRVPESWTLSYFADGAWHPVTGAAEFGVAPDAFNRVAFDPVTTDQLRIDVELRPEMSSGVLEWRVGP